MLLVLGIYIYICVCVCVCVCETFILTYAFFSHRPWHYMKITSVCLTFYLKNLLNESNEILLWPVSTESFPTNLILVYIGVYNIAHEQETNAILLFCVIYYYIILYYITSVISCIFCIILLILLFINYFVILFLRSHSISKSLRYSKY
jgi:hypothetical protein